MTKFLSKPCPTCGVAALVSEPAGGAGATPADGSKTVKQGDTVYRCTQCGTVAENRGRSTSAARKRPAAKKSSARSARKRSTTAKPRARKTSTTSEGRNRGSKA